MGTYTKMKIRLPLDPAARDIIDVLDAVQNGVPPTPLPNHSFFRTMRWDWVCSTCGTNTFDSNGITFEEDGLPWLDRKCSVKNYESCIERFLDYIAPAVALRKRSIVGEHQIDYEDDPSPIEWDPDARRFLIGGRYRGPDTGARSRPVRALSKDRQS